MRYVQLRAFHHVALCGGFSRAAEALCLTQPAVSDQVRRLEEEYDLLLFNRLKKQVVPTPAGERLLAITRRMFDAEGQARELLQESRALRAGTLRVLADSAHHLMPVLARFRQTYPGVKVTVRTGNSDSVIAGLHAYEADVGVLGEIPEAGGFEVVRLSAAPIGAVLPRDHPLAGRAALRLEDLSGAPLVFREQGSKTRRKLEQAAEAAGVALSPAFEAEGREAVREIVAAGGGIGFVSAAEFGADPRLALVPIEGAEGLVMDEALICLRERREGKLVAAVMRMAREAAAAPHGG
jgi:aminoethylphosphonate catabolism LysR family transcriptional regulator